jgi:hypothetical protein
MTFNKITILELCEKISRIKKKEYIVNTSQDSVGLFKDPSLVADPTTWDYLEFIFDDDGNLIDVEWEKS